MRDFIHASILFYIDDYPALRPDLDTNKPGDPIYLHYGFFNDEYCLELGNLKIAVPTLKAYYEIALLFCGLIANNRQN
jgi:hypothetical protein